MARVTADNRTGLSGKMEGVVYVNLNGQTFTRRAPRYKKESETPGMIKNQQRFKQVNAFCALFKDSVIPQIWNGADQRMSGYSLFLKSNMAAFGPDGTVQDANKIKLSTGKLSFPEGFEAKRSETNDNKIEVSWPREMHVGGIRLKEELMVISGQDGQYSDITSTGIIRSQLNGAFELPSLPVLPAPGPMPIYLFFASKDHRDYSQSECFEV